MDEFSGLYRKMCEKAERLQYEWIPQQWDDCFKKGDYRDGLADIVRQKEMPEEKMKKFKAKYAWLPRENDLRESRILEASMPHKIKKWVLVRHYHNDFLKNKEKMKEIENRFKDKVDDIWDVKALMFVMEHRFRRVWDFDKQEWIEIKK